MNRNESVKSFFIFVLIGVFALLMLLVAVITGYTYQAMANDSNQNGSIRTSVLYLCGKIRANDLQYGVRVLQTEQMDVLALSSEHSGKDFTTYIYVYEGKLCEYFAGADLAFDPKLGEKIADAEEIDFNLQDSLLQIKIESAGQSKTFHLALRGGGVQ